MPLPLKRWVDETKVTCQRAIHSLSSTTAATPPPFRSTSSLASPTPTTTSGLQRVLVLLSVIAVVAGNTGQFVTINLWVSHMNPTISASLPILTVSATWMLLCSILGFCVRLVVGSSLSSSSWNSNAQKQKGQQCASDPNSHSSVAARVVEEEEGGDATTASSSLLSKKERRKQNSEGSFCSSSSSSLSALRWMWSPKSIALLWLLGLTNASSSILQVYAVNGTPEILQALMLCTQIFWTMLFAKMFLKDPRSFVNPLVILSFLMCAGGIVLGASPQFSSGPGMSANTRNWTFIFAASMIPGALYNVFASMYMRQFTRGGDVQYCSLPTLSPSDQSTPCAADGPQSVKRTQAIEKDRNGLTEGATIGIGLSSSSALLHSCVVEQENRRGIDNTNSGSGSVENGAHEVEEEDEEVEDGSRVGVDDATVKLWMLTAGGATQLIWMFALLPLDAVPWFGGSKTLADTTSNLSRGWECVFGTLPDCESALESNLLYNLFNLLNYVGSAYLNHYSAALNAMVCQLSSPVGAIVLLIAPSLNVDAQPVQVGASVGAVILIMLGSVVYTLWEQGTRR